MAQECARRGLNSIAGAARLWETRPAGHFSELKSSGSWICLRGSKGTQLDAPAVLQDACHNLVGERQGAPACGAVHRRGAARPHGFQERAQFGSEGFFPLGGKRRKIKFWLWTWLGNPHPERILTREI